MKYINSIYGIVFVLCGCASVPKTVELQQGELVEQKIHIDARLLQECEPLLTLTYKATANDVLDAWSASNVIHKSCTANNHEIITFIQQAFPQSTVATKASASSASQPNTGK